MAEDPHNLGQMLDQITRAAGDRDRISLGDVVEAVGRRSFGPLLLMAGIIMASPLSGIPGMPTSMGVLVFLVALQLLIGRKHFWLPRWLLNRSIARGNLDKSLKWLNPPARFIDRWLRPRLVFLVRDTAAYILAAVCTIIAAFMPVMELVPFSASLAGFALVAFGLSLVARDGVLALIAFTLTGFTFGLVIFNLL